ncbi:MAG: hypothetical protein LBM02_02565 [Lachnospiraceae bacterium]|nr:hypothetical protein [Lachnospiraceae bacterium]
MDQRVKDFADMVKGKALDVSDKVSDTVEVQKKKYKISSLSRQTDKDFQEIGKLVYEKFKNNEITDDSLITICEGIEDRDNEISEIEEEIEEIKFK